MIEPFLKDEAFLADINRVRERNDAVNIWWLGQSGFLIHSAGECLLIDPYLSDSLTTKYAASDKPHVRMTARVIAPEKLNFIDVVTSSHNHTDHLDAETLLPLRAVNPGLQMIISEANRAFVADRLHTDPTWPIGMNDGQPVTCGNFEFTSVPAAHETVSSEFIGLVIRTRGVSIYHSGDTVLYDGMTARLRTFNLDLALLPINGANPARRVAGNLNGVEAANLAHNAKVKCVVPCHYEMFEFNTASPDRFILEATALHQPYKILRTGERLNLT
jgi:L-ascorbate metabolism protein UlaG (beta-lactamase superfamily)